MQTIKSKKVLFIAKKIPWANQDGESIVVQKDIDFFHQKGYEIYFFGINTKKHFVEDVSQKIPNFIQNYETEYINTLSIFRLIFLFIFKNKTWYLNRFYSKKTQRKLNNLMSLNDFDAIIYEGLPCTLYEATNSSKLIYRAHNIENVLWKTKADFLNFNKSSFFNYFKKIIYLNIEKNIRHYEQKQLIRFDLIATLSDIDSNYFKNLYKFVKKAPIFIGEAIQIKRNQESKLKIVILGSMDWQPNIAGSKWFIQNVWKNLNPNEFELTIAGKGATKIFNNIPNLKFDEYWNHFDEIKEKYDVLIVPLFSGGGIRIKILEAIQYQLPLISTTKGIEGIIIDSSIYIANSKEDFIQVLNMISQNRNQLDEIQKKMLNLHLSFKENNLKLDAWI